MALHNRLVNRAYIHTHMYLDALHVLHLHGNMQGCGALIVPAIDLAAVLKQKLNKHGAVHFHRCKQRFRPVLQETRH